MSNDDTGIVVRPAKSTKGSAPEQRGSGNTPLGGPSLRRPLVTAALCTVLGGAVGGGATYLGMTRQLRQERARAAAALTQAMARDADALSAQNAAAKAEANRKLAEGQAEQAAAELAASRAAAEKAIAEKAQEAKALESKLTALLDGQGEVSQSGGAIRLELVDKVLFATGHSELTDRGKKVLANVGAALAEAKDKQIWVQGHTDDQPITPDKGVTPTFPSNWELAAARSLTVVHYLQDVSKVEPQRLAAVAFGEYRPISRTRAKNRRIELVLYPKLDVKPR
ncbi:MAG: OmpA family protein [Myxococcales bacterium]|nr:OmpA family protein [Myxococcales bacterium]HRC58010.1 OmpA family protein [Kofleriaceae bacterium]